MKKLNLFLPLQIFLISSLAWADLDPLLATKNCETQIRTALVSLRPVDSEERISVKPMGPDPHLVSIPNVLTKSSGADTSAVESHWSLRSFDLISGQYNYAADYTVVFQASTYKAGRCEMISIQLDGRD